MATRLKLALRNFMVRCASVLLVVAAVAGCDGAPGTASQTPEQAQQPLQQPAHMAQDIDDVQGLI